MSAADATIDSCSLTRASAGTVVNAGEHRCKQNISNSFMATNAQDEGCPVPMSELGCKATFNRAARGTRQTSVVVSILLCTAVSC